MVYSDGSFLFPQRRGSRDGDLKPKAVRASGLRQMSPAAFSVCGNKMVDRVGCFVWKSAKN
ncbi:MAG: hypothetical protein K2J90_00660 [Lachnospiraceae bacterium]|nr:hypothetical protein [Lachnospiraceae bacterium]